ncbi:MAG: hypothetical protein HY818_00030 [Acetobacterium woodii]|nr:hypothetical protein [Acetobacterium woodii]
MTENASQIILRKLYALRREQSPGVIEITANTSDSGSDFLRNPEDYIGKGNSTLEKNTFNSDDESILSVVKGAIDKNRIIIIIAYSNQSKLELYSYIKRQATDIKKQATETSYSNSSSSKKEGCFIATACYGDYHAPEVIILRKFRDEYLVNSNLGRIAVKIYYKVSPFIASFIKDKIYLCYSIKSLVLDNIVTIIKKKV